MTSIDLGRAREVAEEFAHHETSRFQDLPGQIGLLDLLITLGVAVGTGVVVNIFSWDWNQAVNLTALYSALGIGGFGVLLSLAAYYFRRRVHSDLVTTMSLCPTDLYLQLRKVSEDYLVAENAAASYGQWLSFFQYIQAQAYEYASFVDEGASRRGAVDKESFKREIDSRFERIVDEVMTKLATDRAFLFGFDESETYFFDLFQFGPDEKLFSTHRRRSEKDVNGNPVVDHFRTWVEREGDIGMAIVLKKTLCGTEYAFNTHHQVKDTDRVYFGSRIVAPIPAVNRRPHNLFGALCLNSSDPERLTSGYIPVATILAQCFVPLFYARERGRRRISRRGGNGGSGNSLTAPNVLVYDENEIQPQAASPAHGGSDENTAVPPSDFDLEGG
jgi:hypothetical protein